MALVHRRGTLTPAIYNVGRYALGKLAQNVVDSGAKQGSDMILRNGKRIATRAYQGAKSSIKRFRSRSASAGGGSAVSFQNDMALRYQRKRMPRRRRRAWKRFGRKVKHVMLQMQPLRMYVSDNLGSRTTWSADAQAIFGATLLGTQITNNDEVLQVFKDAYSTATAAASTSYSIYIKSACLDVQLTNGDATYPCYLDVYYLRPRKPWESADQIGSVFTNSYGEMQTITANTATNPAVTAFQNPIFCSYFKITKKVEHLLAPGQTRSLQVRLPMNQYVQGKRLVNEPMMLKNGIALLFMSRGVPQTDGATGAQLAGGTIYWKCQHTIVYGVPPSSTTRSGGHTG